LLLIACLFTACSVVSGQAITPESTRLVSVSPVTAASATSTPAQVELPTATEVPTSTAVPTSTPPPTMTPTPTVTPTSTQTPTATATPTRTPIPSRPKPPSVAAKAAAVLDVATGQFLYGKNATTRLPMASTTKIMTALLALENGNLNQVVNVTVDSRKCVDCSLMGLLPGDRLTLLDLMYGMLLPSGNDAAQQIAITIGGSESAFVSMMNARAQQLGLIDTHYANPHGLDAPGHYTSAVDLAKLAGVALKNPTFAKIVQTSSKTVKGNRTFKLANTNKLLPRNDVFGVKTGNTDAAGRCTVVLFRRGGRDIIVAVLNSQNRDAVALQLANYAYSITPQAVSATPSPTSSPQVTPQGANTGSGSVSSN
jgi:serine-type D-Ala-D-Ala carboxypeptidase (penicillin-binding protein 5/6)